MKDHVEDHPEVADYAATLTTRLGLLDDDGATAVLRTLMPAYLHDYWGRETEFAPARRTLRMYAAPSLGEEPPFDVRDELPLLTPPALVLAGRHDFICGPRWAALLHEGLDNAALTVLEEAGHLAHLEQPTRFDASVLAFLHAQGVVRGPRNS